jgi:hypothetical protein
MSSRSFYLPNTPLRGTYGHFNVAKSLQMSAQRDKSLYFSYLLAKRAIEAGKSLLDLYWLIWYNIMGDIVRAGAYRHKKRGPGTWPGPLGLPLLQRVSDADKGILGSLLKRANYVNVNVELVCDELYDLSLTYRSLACRGFGQGDVQALASELRSH